MINQWQQLNERERKLVLAGGLIAFAYLIYLLIYTPITHAIQNKTAQLKEKTETLQWIQQVKQTLKTSSKKQQINNAKLLSIIATELKQSKFQTIPYQLQQTTAGDVQLSFNNVPYNQFLHWLWTFNNQYTVFIKQFNAERTEPVGTVKLLVILTAV